MNNNNNILTNEQKQKNREEAQSKILQYVMEYIMNGGNQNDYSKN